MSGYTSNANQAIQGLHTDNKEEFQPENTYRFALNGVDNTNSEIEPFLSNESGNRFITTYNNQFVIIGTQYIGDEETILFCVTKNNSLSTILKFKKGNNITEIIPPCPELNLHTNYNVDSTFRQVRGCEKVIYFTDNYNKPRRINLSNLSNYFDNSGNLISDKLNLIYDYSVPVLDLKVLDGNGSLYNGSYNVAIQYLDEDTNATNWITISQPVNVYNDKIDTNYFTINGSANKTEDDEVFSTLFANSKSIKHIITKIIHGENINNFKYYRLAYIIARNNTGLVTEVYASKELPITNNIDYHIFTGNNEDYFKISKEEIFIDKVDINTVKHIEQYDNRLLLANGKGKQVDYCSFQSYASRIRSDYIVQGHNAFGISNHNDKTNEIVISGFLGGEVYAFGIVYVFKDGTQTPVYHIPGRPSSMSTNFSNMEFYEVVNNTYLNKPTISGNDYWGQDYWGNNLTGTKIRHHKFPNRDKVPLTEIDNSYSTNYPERRRYFARVYDSGLDTLTSADFPLKLEVTYEREFYLVNRNYKVTKYIDYNHNIIDNNNTGSIQFTSLDIKDPELDSSKFSMKLYKQDDTEITISHSSYYDDTFNHSFAGGVKVNTIGIQFVNIHFPHPDIVSYYIVVGKRDDFNRRILDKGYINPLRSQAVDDNGNVDNDYFTNAWINNLDVANSQVSGYRMYAKTPKQLFLQRKLIPYQIELEGVYKLKDASIYQPEYDTSEIIEDAVPGSSSNGYLFGLIPGDSDGMAWVTGIRYLSYTYTKFSDSIYNGSPTIYNVEQDQIYFVNAGEKIQNSFNTERELVNLELDNNILAFGLDVNGQSVPHNDTGKNKFDVYYASLLSGIEDIHPNLDNITYYHTDALTHNNSSCQIYKGDIVISHIPIEHSTYYKTTQPRRWGETVINIATLAVLGVGAAALTFILTGGAATIPTVIALASIASSVVGGTSAMLLSQIIKEIDSGNLRYWVKNNDLIDGTIGALDYNDDTVQYLAEIGDGLFIESEINNGLRLEVQGNITSYNTSIDMANIRGYYKNKYLLRDEAKDDKGYSLKPFPDYTINKVNLDYSRLAEEKIFFPLPFIYSCNSKCLEVWKNRILWSERSFDEEKHDIYKSFLANNYRDFIDEYGEITALKVLNNNLIIFNQRMTFTMPANYQEQVNSEFMTFIGTGEFLSLEPSKLADDDIGITGTNYKQAITKFKSNILYIDDNTKKVVLLSNNGTKILSDIGMSKWFYNNLQFDILKLYSHYGTGDIYPLSHNMNNIFGIGFITEYDPVYNRIILVKKDFTIDTDIYDPYFDENTLEWKNSSNNNVFTQEQLINTSFTISFSLNTQHWISFHSFLPYTMFRTSNFLYSLQTLQGTDIYEHSNNSFDFGSFYNVKYDFIIDMVIRLDKSPSQITENIIIFATMEHYSSTNEDSYKVRKGFFDRIICYNSRQCTGLQNLIMKDEENNPTMQNTWLQEQIVNNSQQVLVTNKEGFFIINNIKDYRVNYNQSIFIKNKNLLQNDYFIDKIVNTNAVDFQKQWDIIEPLKDNYLGIRLFYNNFVPNKLKIKTNVDLNNISYT